MGLKGVLGVVGGAIGFIYGGPAAARWGYMIGSTVGSVVDPGTIKGPSIGEIPQQTAQEGGARPIVLVRSPPISGNVIDMGQPRVEKSKSGGKGGPKVVSEQVFRTYSVGFCEGPIGAFRRVWRNNVLVYDVSGASIISDEDNAAFLEKARFFLGTYDQEASPDLEAIYGAGTTPAHRGTAHMVMADEDLTDLRGAIPQWIAEVTSSSEAVLSTDVLDPWTSDTTDPRYEPGDLLLGYSYQYYLGSGPFGSSRDTLNAALADGNTASGGAYNFPIGFMFSEAALPNSSLRVSPAYDRDPGEIESLFLNFNRYLPAYYEAEVIDPDGIIACGAFKNFTPPITGGGSARYWWSGEYRWTGNLGVLATAADISGVWRMASAVSVGAGESVTNNCVNYPGATQQSIISPDVYVQVTRRPHKPEGQWSPVTGSYKRLAEFTTDTGIVTQYPLNPTIESGSSEDTEAFWTAAYIAARDAGDMPSGLVFGVDYPLAITDAWAGTTQAVDGTRPLREIITEICERAGLPAALIDVTQLPDDPVYGLIITNTYAAAEILRALGQMYFFDVQQVDGKVTFIPRGQNHVATITEDDLVEDDQEVSDVKRDDSLTVPRVMHLLYNDTDGGLVPGKQTSERAGDRRSVGEASIQTPLILPADAAARAVVINHKVVTENQKGTVSLCLSDRFLSLIPTDNIHLQLSGMTSRLRIERSELLDGYQNYELAHDRQSSYTSNVEGIPAPPQTAPPSSIVGPTLLVPLDIALLQDADDMLGMSYYVAVAGLTPAWQGALVELSYDGGANYIDFRTALVSATIGELIGTLGDHPQEYPDEVNSVLVRIETPDEELLDTDLIGMMNRTNLAAIGSPVSGWELVNFADVLQSSTPEEWEIAFFLRGRKDTTTRAHAPGETLIMLERGLVGFAPASIVDIGRTLTFRATSIGAPSSSGTVVSIVYQGQTQTERHPGYVRVRRDGTDIIVNWQGVGRLGGGGAVAHGARFDRYRVTFDDHVNPATVINTDETEVVQDASGFASAIPYPDQLLGVPYEFGIQRVVKIGSDYYGGHQAGTVAQLQRFADPQDSPQHTGGMALMNPGLITGLVYEGGWLYASVINTAGGISQVYRIDPNDVTIGAILTYSHVYGAAAGQIQGISTDGTYLYASHLYTNELVKLSLATLSLLATLDLGGTGAPASQSVNSTTLFVALRGTDQVLVVDLGSFTEVMRFNCVEVPLDILATDDLVFVAGRDQTGVYTHAGAQVAVYDSPTLYTGAPVLQELGYDGSRVFKADAGGLKLYGGANGELSLTFPLTSPGPAGGYADGKYFVNTADGEGAVFSSAQQEATVSVSQVNDLTGAGPAIEVTIP